MEKTLVLIKPDGVERKLVGEIIKRFENKGLKIIGLKMINISIPLAKKLYEMHKNKPFFKYLIKFTTAGPNIALVLGSREAVNVVRKIIGATTPEESRPGSIRGDYAIHERFNLVHSADSKGNAEREIRLLFKPEELCKYSQILHPWLYGGKGIDR
ncbi:MAG TPA: nucleoside-diphosphate kinase [bacterium]|nr:nucleoside-diphosphate kinase [bacterium]